MSSVSSTPSGKIGSNKFKGLDYVNLEDVLLHRQRRRPLQSSLARYPTAGKVCRDYLSLSMLCWLLIWGVVFDVDVGGFGGGWYEKTI